MENSDVLVAQRLLMEAWGASVMLEHMADLGGSNRSKVGRYAVRSHAATFVETVIIKRVAPMRGETFAPDAPGGPAGRLFNEWAGLQFLSEIDAKPTLAPKLYGGDREAGVIVIEDMGGGTQLDDLLLGDDATAAEAGLLALMTSLGQLHARTVGRAERFHELRQALGPSGGLRTIPVDTVAQLRERLAAFANAVLGEDWVVNSAEFRHLENFLQPTNPFYAYGHDDPCPDNCLLVDGEMTLLDHEFANFRHALLDGVYGRIHFPTCWCVNAIPAAIVEKMERVYRQALATGCAAARDDGLFAQAVVEACAWHQLTRLPLSLLEQDQEWGISTLRQRTVLRLAQFADAAEAANHLTGLGELAQRLHANLQQRWGAELVPMPLYPAFR